MRKARYIWSWAGLQKAVIQTFWFALPSETLSVGTDMFHTLTTTVPTSSSN